MSWLDANWFNLLQTVGIIITLAIAISGSRAAANATKGANLASMIASNREIWSQLITTPQLQSVMRQDMSPGEKVTYEEREFVKQVIQHGGVSYELARIGGIDPMEGVRGDFYKTFNLPVFRQVWDEIKVYQGSGFVAFVEDCIAGKDLDRPFGPASRRERTVSSFGRNKSSARH